MWLPVDMLINEHKLILQVVDFISKEIEQIRTNKKVNPDTITAFVDFFRTYADRFHHGKEEGLLFKELSQRQLNDSDQIMMSDLITEHAFARKTVTALDNAKQEFIYGKKDALNDILNLLSTLIELYPKHIEKEDKRFFYPCMAYFGEQEKQEMQSNFLGFNQNFTDKRYKQIIDALKH